MRSVYLQIKPLVERVGVLAARGACLAVAVLAPVMAFAQQDERPIYDARLEGYNGSVTLDLSSTALTWLLLCVLGAICLGVMFINPKRTHLD